MALSKAEAARILDPETSRDALSPYAYDGLRLLEIVKEACRIGAEALRVPTREQVERLRGEWIRWDGCPECSVCEYQDTSVVDYDDRTLFCPACGAPMYDEAVDILMERLEVICK